MLVALATTSCRLDGSLVEISPSSSFSPVVADPGQSVGSREFRGVRILPRRDRVAFSIEFAGDEPNRLGEQGGPSATRARLLLDIDQAAGTGGASGEEVACDIRDGRVEIRELRDGLWTLVETGRAIIAPNRISFEGPASVLGDDIYVDWTVELFERSGGDWVPVASHTGTNHPVPTAISRVPTITNLRSEVRQGTLYIQGLIAPRRESRSRIFYDPVQTGGWAMQVFVDTDESPTGYWLGYDYIVRGTEFDPTSGQFTVRQIAPGDEYPGGWGPESGVAGFREQPRRFELRVPLAALGADDGRLKFAIETYATVECAECEGGISHFYADDYFGSCGGSDAPLALGSSRIAESMGASLHVGLARSAAVNRALFFGGVPVRR